MATMTSLMLRTLADHIDKTCVRADYTIGGVTREIPIRRTLISGDSVKKHVYLTVKDPIGVVTRVRLKDKAGSVLAQKTEPVEHKVNTGQLFEFLFTVKEG